MTVLFQHCFNQSEYLSNYVASQFEGKKINLHFVAIQILRNQSYYFLNKVTADRFELYNTYISPKNWHINRVGFGEGV